MYIDKLIEIAEALGDDYSDQAVLELCLARQREELAWRKIQLMPEEGWPGKNEELRKAAAEKASAADEACRMMIANIRQDENSLVELTAQIRAVEAYRRALEWGIRERLASMLSGQGAPGAGVDAMPGGVAAMEEAGIGLQDMLTGGLS